MNRRGIRGNRRGGSASQATSPAALSGLVQWLRGDIGASASAWTDQSTGGHNGAQPTGGKQPSVVASVINGHAVERFAGAQGMPSGAWQVATVAMSFFTVVKIASLGTATIYSKAFAGTDWEVTGAGAGIVYWAVSSGGGTKAQSNAAIDGGTPHVLIGTYDSTLGSNQTKLYVDGVLQTTQGTFAGPIPFGADQVCVGSYSSSIDTEAANLTGDVAEAGLVSRAYTTAEIAGVNAFFKSLYATP